MLRFKPPDRIHGVALRDAHLLPFPARLDGSHEAYPMPNGHRRVALHKARLTTRTVADARPGERRYIVWDEELTGFGLRVSPSGLRSFIVQYRAGEGGRRAASHKKVLGHFPVLTPARARARAREALRAAAGPRTSDERGARSMPTLRRAFEDYVRSRATVTDRTRARYRRLLERHGAHWLDRRLDELGREDVERRFLALSEGTGLAIANAFVKLLGAVYRAACADHDDLRDPIAEWRLGGGKLHRAPRRTIAPPAEVLPRWRRGVEADVPEVLRDMVWVGLYTGLRVSEVSDLKWTDIDAAGSWLRVPETKSGRPFELPVSRQVKGILERRRAAADAHDRWVFPGPSGRGPYKRAGDWYARVSERAGTKFWFHACRNCFITVAVRDLMLPESLVKRLVNHAPSGDVTEGYAAAWTREELREASQAIADRVEALAFTEVESARRGPAR